jgi:dipeptidyl aminopeptidase/acylaminoacyl peptidase
MMQFSYRLARKAIGLALLGSIMLPAALPSSAQTAYPNAIARVYNNDETYLTIYSPEGRTPGQIILSASARADLSPDGRWLVTLGYQDDQEILEYRLTTGRPTQLGIDAGFSVLDTGISDDGNYLTYTAANLETRQWLLGIMDLRTEKLIEYTSTFDSASPVGENQMGGVIGFDGARLLLNAFVPFADGNFGGVYLLQLAPTASDFTALAAGRYPLPTAQQVAAAGVFAYAALSPDSNTLALLYNDPANPPANYQSLGPGFTLNTLGIKTLADNQGAVIAKAGTGQGLEAMAWTPDGQSIVFTGGDFAGSYYVATPFLFSVVVATGQVTVIGKLSDDPAEIIGRILVCGNTLFYDVNRESADGGRVATLYSAPLDNLAAKKSLIEAAGVYLQGCAASF